LKAPAKRRAHKLTLTTKQRRDLRVEANRRREAGTARKADREGQAWFESRQLEGQKRLWPISGVVTSSWLLSGAIRQRLFHLDGSVRNVAARNDGQRRIEPFPWRMMYEPSFLAALLAPDGQVAVEER